MQKLAIVGGVALFAALLRRRKAWTAAPVAVKVDEIVIYPIK